MRIAQHRLQALVAVLSLAALLICPESCLSIDNSTIAFHRSHSALDSGDSWWSSVKQAQSAMLKELAEKGQSMDCCPSEVQMVEPKGGINQRGLLVQLYQAEEAKQRFYEVSCKKKVEGNPCFFMERKLHNHSKCVQKYSYTYALVRTSMMEHQSDGRHHHQSPRYEFPFPPTAAGPTGSRLVLDYIKVRSGCSCEITPKVFHKKKRGGKKTKSKRVHHESVVDATLQT